MNRETDRTFAIPPHSLPNGTPGQLSCMRAVSEGLRRLSRRDLERLVKTIAEETNRMNREEAR